MYQLLAFVGIAVSAVVVYLMAGRVAEGTEQVFRGYFAGYRPDPWPHGVQEEYPEHRWGHRSADAPRPRPARSRGDEPLPAAEITDVIGGAGLRTVRLRPHARLRTG
jgi:hypothetical protein